MEIEDIESKARDLGINPDGKSKLELIHSIQKVEGHTPCYGHGMFVCSNLECLWRQDCCGLWKPISFEVI